MCLEKTSCLRLNLDCRSEDGCLGEIIGIIFQRSTPYYIVAQGFSLKCHESGTTYYSNLSVLCGSRSRIRRCSQYRATDLSSAGYTAETCASSLRRSRARKGESSIWTRRITDFLTAEILDQKSYPVLAPSRELTQHNHDLPPENYTIG